MASILLDDIPANLLLWLQKRAEREALSVEEVVLRTLSIVANNDRDDQEDAYTALMAWRKEFYKDGDEADFVDPFAHVREGASEPENPWHK